VTFRPQEEAATTKREQYGETLRALDGPWEPFLASESGLPGPRGNLELIEAVADVGDEPRFRGWADADDEFLAACGVVGLGRLAADGRDDVLAELRRHASDGRWRVREAVAMALQRLGDARFDDLLAEMERWADGERLEQRAAAAALCEPRLLREPARGEAVVALLARVVDSLVGASDAGSSEARVLRQGLGYCVSVATVAAPAEGKALLERLAASEDADARWIARENLRKARLGKLDADWTARTLARLSR
jgi:hypothetical protein